MELVLCHVNNPAMKNETFIFLIGSYFVAPPEDQEGQSEEEQLKQKTKERARKEFLGAVASEGKEIGAFALKAPKNKRTSIVVIFKVTISRLAQIQGSKV